MSTPHYDIFMSYSNEDGDVAESFTHALLVRGVTVWRDKSSLKVGDSLRRSIDSALANATYGVVILSESFFSKQWPQRELDGLVTREIGEARTVVLPVWHKLAVDTIRAYSPPLADKFALDTSAGIGVVADQIAFLFGKSARVKHLYNTGHYIRAMEISAKILEKGSHWIVEKQFTVVAAQEDLAGIHTSFRIDDMLPESITDYVVGGSVVVENVETAHPRAISRFFRFKTLLRKGEECTFTYVRDFRKKSPQFRDMLVKKGDTTCDEVVLRIAFETPPQELLYRITDRSEIIGFKEESVSLSAEGEASRFIRKADPALGYGFYWTYTE